jgi:AraC-like DNA-binding protein
MGASPSSFPAVRHSHIGHAPDERHPSIQAPPQSAHRYRFSTDDLPPKERFEMYRDGLRRRHMDMEFVDRSSGALHFAGQFQSFGSITAGFVRGTPSSYVRARRNLTDSRDRLAFLIHRTGHCHVEGPGLDAGPCDGAVLLSSRHEFAFQAFEESCWWSISLERQPLEPLLAGIEGSLLCRVPAGNPALRLLTGYLETLFGIDEDVDPILTANHLGDLIVSAAGVCGDAQALARERGVTAARQGAVLDGIAKRAGEKSLDPACIAAGLGVSVRYLHRLLEPTGRSFSEHLLQSRLDRAAGMLRDPGRSHLQIATIASEAGFSNISHFNRAFRHAFGDTPNGVRVRARRAAI